MGHYHHYCYGLLMALCSMTWLASANDTFDEAGYLTAIRLNKDKSARDFRDCKARLPWLNEDFLNKTHAYIRKNDTVYLGSTTFTYDPEDNSVWAKLDVERKGFWSDTTSKHCSLRFEGSHLVFMVDQWQWKCYVDVKVEGGQVLGLKGKAGPVEAGFMHVKQNKSDICGGNLNGFLNNRPLVRSGSVAYLGSNRGAYDAKSKAMVIYDRNDMHRKITVKVEGDGLVAVPGGAYCRMLGYKGADVEVVAGKMLGVKASEERRQLRG